MDTTEAEIVELVHLAYGLHLGMWTGEEKEIKARRFMSLLDSIAYLAHI